MRYFVLLVTFLAACSYYQDPSQAEANIVRPGNFTAGSGVVESVGVLPNANRGNTKPSSKGRSPDPNLYRLSLRMDTGGFQQVDIDNGTFMAGEAVELTNDGRVLRITGTTLNEMMRR
ncbi:MAG: hypothetical protein ABR570_13990 [Burkholderiales bacterium]